MATLGSWVLGASSLGGSNGGAVTEPPYVNLANGAAPRNGTSSHTINFGFTPAANTLLVVVVHGPGTHSTPSTGWVERLSTTGTGELAVYTKFAVGDESSIVVDHSLSNIPLNWIAYAFPVGSGWVAWTGSSPTTDTWPSLSGMPATDKVILAIRARVITSTTGATDIAWGSGWTQDYEATTVAASGGTNGTTISAARRINHTSDTWTISNYFHSSSGTYASDRQFGVLALDVAPAVATTRVTKSVPTAWGVRGRVTKSAATSWDVVAGTTQVTKSTPVAWSARSAVVRTAPASWDVRAQVQKEAASAWSVASGVQRTAGSSWDVREATQRSLATAWSTRQRATRSVATSWHVTGGVSRTWPSSWDTRGRVARPWPMSWDVIGAPGVVSRTFTTGWEVRARLTRSIPTSWGARGVVVASIPTAWSVAVRVVGLSGSAWSVRQGALVVHSIAWSTFGGVVRVAATSWAVRISSTATIEVSGPYARGLVLDGPRGRSLVLDGPRR